MYWIWIFNIARLLLPFFLLGVVEIWSAPAHAAIEVVPVADGIHLPSRVRAKALRGLDQFLNWTLSDNRSYCLLVPQERTVFHDESAFIRHFARGHSYFSPTHPLVAKVSQDPKDLFLVKDLLSHIQEQIVDPAQKELLTMEVLAKVVAYRDLHLGDDLLIPLRSGAISYRVDKIFNLWLGMPAFGLLPQVSGSAAPILLFRGTDLSLDSQRGWASVMSDLDIAGIGLNAFQHAQGMLHAWLEKVSSLAKARVVGFSLGGALAAYTFLYENALISKEISYAFNMPGISEAILTKWEHVPKASFTSYVTKGDPISKMGQLLGTVYQLSTTRSLQPLDAHTLLMLAQAETEQAVVDVAQENLTRQGLTSCVP
jgi:hypothetical protein